MTFNPKYFAKPNDPILVQRAKTVPLNEITSKEIKEIINKLLFIAQGEQKTLAKPILVGLAAPQVKISKQIILVDVGADGRGKVTKLEVYINPKIIWKSKKKEEWYEGCFSTDKVRGIVQRPKSVKIQAYNIYGKKIEEKHTGYTARIFQHEIDHLNGIEFVNHIQDNDKLHWVEDDEFPIYRNNEGWRNWNVKCPREKWNKIKGIKK